MDQTTAPDPRAELIADLRAFADLLERRPDMPLPHSVRVQHSLTRYDGDEATRIAEVHRIAAVLGVDVDDRGGAFAAELSLGAVEYVVHTQTDHGTARFWAERSYEGCVEPEAVAA